MNFSFVLPSRGDYNRLKKMFDSFERTTKYKNKIEFLLAVDTGNTDIIKAIKGCKYSFYIQFYERDKTRDFTNDYYNWLADRTIGDNIITFNDDAWMRTNNWDKKLLNRINEIPTSVYMLDIPDTARVKYNHRFPCFPLISRRAFCTLGFALCPKIKMFPGDQVTTAIYQEANIVFPVRNVLIEHEHSMDYSEGSGKKHMLDIFDEDSDSRKQIDLTEYIYRLLHVSANYRKEPTKIQRIINIIKEK